MPEKDERPLILIGITHSQTCLVLPARLRALQAAGFRVALICSPGPLLDELVRKEKIEAYPVAMRRSFSPFSDVLGFVRLWRLLRRLRPAMTEFSTPKAGLLGNVAAKLCGVPVRVYLLRGLRLETASGLRYGLLLAAERLASACADHVVCNSRSLLAKARVLRLAPGRKLQLIGSGSSQGVDIYRFCPGMDRMRGALGIRREAPVIGCVGRLTQDKGIPELIAAFGLIRDAVPAARLLLVGWFDESEDRISEALRRRIERDPAIICTGYVADTAPYYRAMDLMVLATWREGFPNVVLEAAATQIPVVATIATGSRDAVVPEVTGLLVPAGYPEAIAEAVLRLMRDPELRARMGSAAREWTIERFASRDVLALTGEFYGSLMARTVPSEVAVLATDAAAVGD